MTSSHLSYILRAVIGYSASTLWHGQPVPRPDTPMTIVNRCRWDGLRRTLRQVGEVDGPLAERSCAGDVGGEEVDPVAVEVSAGAVVVLGSSGVGMAGQDLGVTERDTRVEGVGDRCVA